MGNLRRRILLAERSAESKARSKYEFRVAGMTPDQARAELLRRVRQALSQPGLTSDMRGRLEQLADRLVARLEPIR